MKIVYLSIIALFFMACSSKKDAGKKEDFLFMDQFSVENGEESVEQAMRFAGNTDFNVLYNAVFSVYENLQIIKLLTVYNANLNEDLNDAFEEYNNFIEGSFFHYYAALFHVAHGDKDRALKDISLFLKKYKKNNDLKKIASQYKALIKGTMSANAFWQSNKDNAKLFPLVQASVRAFNKKGMQNIINESSCEHNLAQFNKKGLEILS